MKFRQITLVSALLLLWGCGAGESSFSDALEKTVYDLNANCPQTIDSETRLDAITYERPLTIVYHYSLTSLVIDPSDSMAFRKAVWPGLVSNIRVSRDMKKLRENDVIFRYTYRDKNKQHVCAIIIKPHDYH
jgi:hypothetical protein